jgi:NAD(P)-dependent dehydrogenase (short-subunit alcohol dehydrogenase family)
MSKLTGKVAVVTGASKGIGSGIATALAAAGARVAVNYSSDRKGAERVAQAIIDSGGEAIAVGADVSKAADVARLFKEVDAAFGRLDVLVNNAWWIEPDENDFPKSSAIKVEETDYYESHPYSELTCRRLSRPFRPHGHDRAGRRHDGTTN